LREN